MRLDQYLVLKGYYASREKSQFAIKKGDVMVNDKVILKPSFEVSEPKITILFDSCPYVSHGGLKLERAITVFKLDFKDKIVLDIGASTGGFTDCSLAFGAKTCVSVDVGSNQLAPKLLNDERVIPFEKTNITDLELKMHFDYLVMDVSFVSIKKIIPHLLKWLDATNYLICLIKPQFELGKVKLKNGVVRDPKIHFAVVTDLFAFFRSVGLYVHNFTYSTQRGKTGNLEFLVLLSKKEFFYKDNIKEIINNAHKM